MASELLAKLARALDARGISYMIIGGQAVLVHGEPRLTRDIDLTLGVDLDGLPAAVEIARELRLEPLVDPEAFTRETMVLPCADPSTGMRVDFVFSHTRYEKEALARVHRVQLHGVAVRFASPEDLVIHKLLAGRPRDLEDVRGILAKQPRLDKALVRRWLKDFESALGESFLERWAQFDSAC